MTPKTPTGDPSDQPQKASKSQRQSAAREKSAQMRQQAEARARRQKALIIGITVAVVLALTVVVWIFVQSARNDISENADGPPGLTDVGGFVVGQDDAPVTVSLYVDFLCPSCKAYEAENGALLADLAEKGEIKVEYVPVSILDRLSEGTKYSTRSAGAAYCVAENDPGVFVDYLAALYENQPEEGSSGLTDETIAQIADVIGAGAASTDCIADGTYEDFVTKTTEDASVAGLQGTPTVKVNGTTVEDLSQKALVDQINVAKDAAGEGG
jgi:protein-disulfide isomerase